METPKAHNQQENNNQRNSHRNNNQNKETIKLAQPNKKKIKNKRNRKPNENNPGQKQTAHKNYQNRHKSRISQDKITESYNKSEFSCKCGECNNRFRMSLFLIGVLESLKLKFDDKPEVIKGYICEEAASKQAITKKNYHVMGKAIDFKLPQEKLTKAFRYLESVPEVTGLGLDPDHGFIHIDTRDKEPQKWIYQKGEQLELSPELRQKYDLGEDVSAERKDFITA